MSMSGKSFSEAWIDAYRPDMPLAVIFYDVANDFVGSNADLVQLRASLNGGLGWSECCFDRR